MNSKIAVLSVLLCLAHCKSTGTYQSEGFPLTIVHVNDLHSHFEEVNVETGRCHADMAANKECYGGTARMFTQIQSMWKDPENQNMMLLNAGDYYQGTIWYSLFKYQPVAEFANMLNYTAMGLGNHDFDDSIDGLKPFANIINFDLLAANVKENPSNETTTLFGNNVKKSKVVQFGDVSVGIIGYITTYTPYISSPDSTLEFLDEIESVAEEARKLKAQGVNILIALGHSGYDLDVVMARDIPELDLVVGGHTHTFLYTGEKPSVEEPEGPYPTYITQSSGKVVPVVQAYCYSKYLGHLRLRFDTEGELLKPEEESGVAFSQVIMLDGSIPMDANVDQELQKYRDQMTEYYTVIGNTSVFLKKEDQAESNIGDVISDSMVEIWERGVDIGFINNGGIRSNIIEGNITGEDVFNVLPFNNTVDKLIMTGDQIRGVLEGYAYGLCPNASCYAGTFLQMSGLRVTYDIRADNQNNRISRLETSKCFGDIDWCPIVLNANYSVAVPSFLAGGGSRTFNFPDNSCCQEKGPSDYDALENYVKLHSPITQAIEDRIIINYYDTQHE